MDWKDKTCEKCQYQVDDFCRRLPPTHVMTVYPKVHFEVYTLGTLTGMEWEKACAEYRERMGE